MPDRDRTYVAPFRIVLFFAVLPLFVGCVTAPTPEGEDANAFAARFVEERAAYYIAPSSRVVVSLSAAAFPELIDGVARRFVGQEISDRIFHLVVSADDGSMRAVVYGRFARISLGTALRKNGYKRERRGLWRSADGGVEVEYVDQGVIVVSLGNEPSTEPSSRLWAFAPPQWACRGAGPDRPSRTRGWAERSGSDEGSVLPWESLYVELESEAGPLYRSTVWVQFPTEPLARVSLVVGRLALLEMQRVFDWSDDERNSIAVDRCGAVIRFAGVPLRADQAVDLMEAYLERSDP